MAEGWIKLHRKIFENVYYFSEEFTRSQAWVDMILLANHRPNMFFQRGIKVVVQRGEIGWSVEKLAVRWKWSRGKVERFLKELETSGQIVRQKTNITTLISIVNYDTYQDDSNADDTADSKPNSKADGHQTVKQTDTNKNDKKEKNDKNDKKNVGDKKPGNFSKKNKKEFIPPVLDEVEAYFILNGFTKELAGRFFKHYATAEWHDARSNKVRNWKQKAQTVWFTDENKSETNTLIFSQEENATDFRGRKINDQ